MALTALTYSLAQPGTVSANAVLFVAVLKELVGRGYHAFNATQEARELAVVVSIKLHAA